VTQAFLFGFGLNLFATGHPGKGRFDHMTARTNQLLQQNDFFFEVLGKSQ